VRRRLASLCCAVALVLTASGCASLHGLHGTNDQGVVVGGGGYHEIPVSQRGDPLTLTGRDLDGRSISLQTLRGKPTVVNVWGSWCASCHQEEPYLAAAAKKLGSRANFVGIDSRDSGTAQAKAYNQRYGISWPSFFSPGGEALLSFTGVITPNSIPSTIVLDAQGRAAAAIIGAVPSTLTLVQIVQDVTKSG
jgi:thiol-disulfide isomerase/thioredoxin